MSGQSLGRSTDRSVRLFARLVGRSSAGKASERAGGQAGGLTGGRASGRSVRRERLEAEQEMKDDAGGGTIVAPKHEPRHTAVAAIFIIRHRVKAAKKLRQPRFIKRCIPVG